MRLNKYIKKRTKICVLLPIVSAFYLSACQPLPKNTALANSSLDIGIVYIAKVKAIYPIFVNPDSNRSYSDGVGEIAGTYIEKVYEKSRLAYRYSAIASNLASTTTGIYEERYAGLFCHYILEVNNESLIDDIKDNDDFDEDEDEDDREREFNDRLEELDDVIRSGNKTRAVEIDENSGFSSSPPPGTADEPEDEAIDNDEIDLFKEKLEELISINKEKEKEIRRLKKKNIPQVFVVNPCRDFEIDSSVTVSKSEEAVILQPSVIKF